MKKLSFLSFLFTCSLAIADTNQIDAEKIQQYILISNNAEKCFQPELWEVKNKEKEQILTKQSEFENVIISQYDIALMTELFGNDAVVKLNEDNIFLERFNQMLSKLNKGQTTAKNEHECKELSDYLLHLKRKHIY